MNADFARAMERLVPDKLRRRWTNRKLAGKKYSCSAFMMYLGVEGEFDLPHHTIHISGDYEKNLDEIENRHVLSEDPSFYVQNACVTDPGLAPRGHSTLYVLAPVTHQHAKLRDSLHDGIKLPRVFRKAGFRTDLFDATDLATCRMYHTNAGTWRGLGKNATEGIAAPGTIVPMTALLVGGQLLALVLLAGAPMLSTAGLTCVVVACMLALAPRLIGVWRFRQPLGSALLQPLGVLALLMIQWHALGRHMLGNPSEWKGRSYGATPGIHPIKVS